MKNFITLTLMAVLIATAAVAAPTSVSNKVNTHFAKTFNEATNIAWEIGQEYDKANFELNNEQITVFYSKDGDLIGRSKIQAFDKLPKSAIETLTTKYTYPDYQIKECIEFINADNEKNYYASFETKNETIALEITKYGSVNILVKTRK
jgi:Flp pilus assembly pilin Flp